MNIENAAIYAALVFFVFSMPSGRMLELSAWQYQCGLKASLPLGLGIALARALFFVAGFAAVATFVNVMPDGLVIARISAVAFLSLHVVRCLMRLRHPVPLSSNDNLPVQGFMRRFWHGVTSGSTPLVSFALAAALLVFILSPGSVTVQTAKMLAVAHVAASLLSLAAYALIAHPLLARINRRQNAARHQRIARLLRSGLPRVSARYRQDAA